MCGIIGYTGHRLAASVLLKGLKRLEYRGYDSTGVAVLEANQAHIVKQAGKVSALAEAVQRAWLPKAHIGIGHTRWATHGAPNDINAHPHQSGRKKLIGVHNGIIENYGALRQELQAHNTTFVSETDTEIFISFIEWVWMQANTSLEEALRLALPRVVGAYALVLFAPETDQLFAVRKGSPLVIGVGKDETFIASDATPIVEYTNKVIYLEEENIAVIEQGNVSIKNFSDVPKTPYIHKLEMGLSEIEKAGYPHFMLKEIHTQPEALIDCMRGRLRLANEEIILGGLMSHTAELSEASRILLIACGTSWHAALIGEYVLEELCRIPVEVEYASEFRYRNPVIGPNDVVIALSQSGETADTLAAVQLVKQKGSTVLGLVNVVGSSIARATDAGVYLHAGPEIGVASTKSFTTQITALLMMAIQIARLRGQLKQPKAKTLVQQLSQIPKQVRQILTKDREIKALARKFKNSANFLYLGRGPNFPVALEGALKLKEISYIHAEGYPAAEMKHGPIALIDEHMPVVFIATQDQSYDKVLSNITEVKARGGQIIALVTKKDPNLSQITDHIIQIPHAHDLLLPILSVVPLQLLAYHIADLRGCNVDQPRNLAKSVTVE